ncbi:FAD-binding oxidoreductase [Rhodococcus triatomae]|uniref:FAD/FMN-containing dehydrogenase n=1 Tax=Rhodococcus triatomae TaxID=300028 RepID=A0A1G8FLG7_9NOCA|nr:FAD-binding oxidoreductase [Rhodococcus triatomae]QNG19517.1 FAD-binding oxidoreductase [Rhodococcus triatomae]QNG24568.1 FAD-binding oxidoreductase [Rhodococcus triatomae]SDH82984.1 FAD/FMN-containing dehydrogenase [Rhodococcus triatomae]
MSVTTVDPGSLARLAEDLGDITHSSEPRLLRAKSRDRFAQSPILREVLRGKIADIYIAPGSKAELRTVVAACARHRIPITVRGGGTAQFGQGVPLSGGAVVDVTGVTGIVAQRLGTVRALCGTLVADIDAAIRPTGWELRMHPSTTRQATIGGYLAGGHAGIGSCHWGILRDRGNITAIEVMTVEEEPRLVELVGADVNTVHHAYGANGIITEVELPTAPAWTWQELVISFPDFASAARFSVEICRSEGVLKKLVSLHADPLPTYFPDLAGFVPPGHAMVLAMAAEQSMPDVEDLVRECGGSIGYRCDEGAGVYDCPLYEFTWGHSMMHYQRLDRAFIGLLAMFPADTLLESIMAVHTEFAAVGPMHLEMKRFEGGLSAQGSPVFVFESQEQVAEMTTRLQEAGLSIANTHTPTLRASGMKPWAEVESRFKRMTDPHGLLAQGKSDDEKEDDISASTALPNSGWSYRTATPS